MPKHFVRWRQLVTADWLAALLVGRCHDGAPTRDWRLFEVGCDAGARAMRGHIPGAGYIDTCELEGGPWWNKVDDASLENALLGKGIRCDTTVILYGRSILLPARAAHLLLYAGVKDVRLLDGGLEAWQAAGHPITNALPSRWPRAEFFGCRVPAHPEYLADLGQVQRVVGSREGVLVSNRTWSEHIGEISGYSYIAAKGDIPGARWGRAGQNGDVHSMSDFQRANGTLKPPAEVCAFWAAEGITPHRHATFYCGTGWRASLAFFYAWLMGWQRISVFDGGWLEWSQPRDTNDPTRHCGRAHNGSPRAVRR